MFSANVNALLDKITPVNCEAYLKSKGWHLTAKLADNKAHFYRQDNVVKDIFVPLDTELGDYGNRIYDLVYDLQEFENRPLEYIANDIVLSNYDIFRIIAFKGNVIDYVPLGDASTLISKSLVMISEAAQSLYKQKSYSLKQSTKFMSNLRLGHTERGGFVISIQVPVAPIIPIQEIESSEDVFERLVTTRLCSLITIAISLANTCDKNLIKQSISFGMNADFIEALADVTDCCGESGANLDMAWAPVRPCHEKNKFCIKREMAPVLREIGKRISGLDHRITMSHPVELENIEMSKRRLRKHKVRTKASIPKGKAVLEIV
jgi:hypothetical protein